MFADILDKYIENYAYKYNTDDQVFNGFFYLEIYKDNYYIIYRGYV